MWAPSYIRDGICLQRDTLSCIRFDDGSLEALSVNRGDMEYILALAREKSKVCGTRKALLEGGCPSTHQ